MRLSVFEVVLKNILNALRFSVPRSDAFNGYIIKKMSFYDAIRSVVLYREIFGEPYGWGRALFLVACSRRFSVCALSQDKEVVAFEWFRLAEDDLAEGTIHESFVGVENNHAGTGLATALRRFSAKSFSENGFLGISSRVALSNRASMRSAEKLGFVPVRKYTNLRGEKEAYLVLWFGSTEKGGG